MEKVPACLILTIVAACGAMMAAADKNSFENPSPIDTWFGPPLPPQPRPGFYKYLGDCIDQTTQACGITISKAVFGNGKFNDPTCCQKVVKAGYLCNRALTYILAKFDKFKPKAALIFKNGEAIYAQCSKH